MTNEGPSDNEALSVANSENLVPCSNCGRKFAAERIDIHTNICTNSKHRDIYDIAKKRIVGTEAEGLYKAGKLKLDAPKPMEKKSALHAKLSTHENGLNKTVLPPIKKKPSGDNIAYSVTFDGNDQLKTKKNSKFTAPLHMNAPPNKIDKK